MSGHEMKCLAIFNSHQQLKAISFEILNNRWRVHYADRLPVWDYAVHNSILIANLQRLLA